MAKKLTSKEDIDKLIKEAEQRRDSGDDIARRAYQALIYELQIAKSDCPTDAEVALVPEILKLADRYTMAKYQTHAKEIGFEPEHGIGWAVYPAYVRFPGDTLTDVLAWLRHNS